TLQLAIRTRRRLATVTGAEAPDRCLLSPEAMRALFADAPGALTESIAVAEACTLDLGRRNVRLPRMSGNDDGDDGAALVRLCHERLAAGRAAGRWTAPGYDARLDHELGILRTLGFAG